MVYEGGQRLSVLCTRRLPASVEIDYQILPDGVPGDYNGDGVVDAADYVLWRKGGPLQNQVDDPDHVNMQDYIEWRVSAKPHQPALRW